MGELGRGAYGVVEKMMLKSTDDVETLMAVKVYTVISFPNSTSIDLENLLGRFSIVWYFNSTAVVQFAL